MTERSSRNNSKALPVGDIDNERTYTVGSLIAAATGVVGISISTSTSTSISIGVDDGRWTYTVRPFAAVAIDVVVGPAAAAANGVVCISISVVDGGGWTRNAVTIVNRTW